MSFDSTGMQAVAASLGEEIAGQYEAGAEPQVRTVGVLATVSVADPGGGPPRTVTHYRFEDGPESGECPNYIALGLLTQVGAHLSQVRREGEP